MIIRGLLKSMSGWPSSFHTLYCVLTSVSVTKFASVKFPRSFGLAEEDYLDQSPTLC